jgi:hypothetical protein
MPISQDIRDIRLKYDCVVFDFTITDVANQLRRMHPELSIEEAFERALPFWNDKLKTAIVASVIVAGIEAITTYIEERDYTNG